MSKKISLTIVIPAYNEERHLKACLDGIANQTEKPDEVIVVNNNSADSTVEIAESYPFVKLISESRQGIVFARNRGFDTAKSEIIGRIDADTRLPRNWVARVKKFYSDDRHSDFALTGGGYFYNLRWPRVNGWALSQMSYRFNRLITGFYILWGSNMAFPRRMWRKVKEEVCDDDAMHEDLDLAIHLHRLGYRIYYMANLRVGVYMKRVWENRDQQNKHLRRWPYTLKTHGFKQWWLSISGNILLKYAIQPLGFVIEILARLAGRKALR